MGGGSRPWRFVPRKLLPFDVVLDAFLLKSSSFPTAVGGILDSKLGADSTCLPFLWCPSLKAFVVTVETTGDQTSDFSVGSAYLRSGSVLSLVWYKKGDVLGFGSVAQKKGLAKIMRSAPWEREARCVWA